MRTMIPISVAAIFCFALFMFYELVIHGHPQAAIVPAAVVLLLKVNYSTDKGN